MCMTKKELESKVEELRSLKTMKEEIENELKAVEHVRSTLMVGARGMVELTDI